MNTIAFLTANPDDTTRLRLDVESRAIEETLRKTEYRAYFELVQHWAVRAGDLQHILLRHRPEIVHFSGHGSAGSEIILENDDGLSRPVSTQALEQLFALLKDDLRCVVLNACYSERQAKAIARHVPAVVGIASTIPDEAAIDFSSSFYQALGYGRDLRTAYLLGCNQIALDHHAGDETPQLIALLGDPSEIRLVQPDSEIGRPASDSDHGLTGIEIYCEKPWSGLGLAPRCTITIDQTGFALKRQLMWEALVFLPLEGDRSYQLKIVRPSDMFSFKATTSFRLSPGEVKQFRYRSPPISFMAGEIQPITN